MTGTAQPVPLRHGRPLLIAFMALASIPVSQIYTGDSKVMLAYCAASILLVAAAAFGRLSFFCIFLAGFLALGFWAKAGLYWVAGTPLIEPVGSFAGTNKAWDQALLAAASGLAGIAAAMGAVKLLDRRTQVPDLALAAKPFPGYAMIALFAISAATALVLFMANFHFAILKIGTVPRIALHPYLYAIVSFTISWGAALWLATLAFWLVGLGRAPVDFPIYVIAIEGAAAALSMGSRAQMILHVGAGVAAWIACRHRLGWRLTRLRSALAAGFVGVLFMASLAGVSLDRISNFYGPPPPVASKPAERRAGGTVARPGADAERSAVSTASIERMAGEVMQLFVGRWIGLEGVLAVSSEPGLGVEMLRRGIAENPSRGVDAMYQRLAKSIYTYNERFVFMTVPGPIAVLLYGGSLALVAIGMAVVFMIGYALERLCDAWVRNPGASAMVGAAQAYLVVQMMFPRTLMIFAIELFLALALLGGFRLIVRPMRPDARPGDRQDAPP
jgi:hypothetical protein